MNDGAPGDGDGEKGGGEKGGERIAKVMARAGLCSRREAERWIAAGRVAVDGTVLTSPGVVVGPASRIVVDGKPLPVAPAPRMWRYHKPAGVLTTRHDPQGRPTLFDTLPPALPRVLTVGRLDMSAEGLLLLTNDGAVARHLELPSTGWTRRYRVRVFGRVDADGLAVLGRGITVSGIRYGPIEATLERQSGANAWLMVSLAEGKNREVRKALEHLGYVVNRLIRVAYGPFQLGHLERGGVEEIQSRVLRDQLPALFPKAARDTPRVAHTPPARPSARAPARASSRPRRPRADADRRR